MSSPATNSDANINAPSATPRVLQLRKEARKDLNSSPMRFSSEMELSSENNNPNVGRNLPNSSSFTPAKNNPRHEGNSPMIYPSSSKTKSRSDFNSELESRTLFSSPSTNVQRNDLDAAQRIKRFLSVRGSVSDLSEAEVSNENLPQEAEVPSDVKMFVWGTNVDPTESILKFRNFLLNFSVFHRLTWEKNNLGKNFDESRLSVEDKLPYYPRILKQRLIDGVNVLNLDCMNLKSFPDGGESLFNQLVNYPQEIILSVFDHVTSLVLNELAKLSKSSNQVRIKVRPYNLNHEINLNELNPEDLEKLVTIKGFIIRVSNPIPELKSGFFTCNKCEHSLVVNVDNGRLDDPIYCKNYGCENGYMQFISARSLFYNKQIIKLQEMPDKVQDGQTPQTISLVAYDDLVDCTKAGDRIEVTGIYKGMPVRLNPKQTVTKSVFKTFVDVLHAKCLNETLEKMNTEEDIMGDNERIEYLMDQKLSYSRSGSFKDKILELSEKKNLFDLLAKSLAPSIYGHLDAKKAVLLQLFGGSNPGNNGRGNIHVLLCGDPATSKSQILMYAHRIAPRGLYTSGKGSSSVGLTAHVTRDPETRQIVLESGALVLSDGGLCCIDEFDKMSESTRSILHEVMEQQTVSVAKSGIIATLNAKTSILAAANPIHSKWNPKLPLPKNINLPPTLLSRFDIVYLMLDRQDEANDTLLAKHIISLYMTAFGDKLPDDDDTIVDASTFSAYIRFARQHCQPVLSYETIEFICQQYVRFRNNKNLSATTRLLEGMVRLSEAHARMRLSNAVEVSDAEETVRLIQDALLCSCIDPVTGLIDMDLLTTGKGSRERKLENDLKLAVKKILTTKNLNKENLASEVSNYLNRIVTVDDIESVYANVMQEIEEKQSSNFPIS